MPTLRMTGRIVPLQPISINVPAGQRDYVPNKNVYLKPLFNEAGQRVVVPCVPGSNIKGALRTSGGVSALCEVYGAVPGKPETFGVLSIDQHYNASSGGLVDAKAQTALDLVDMRENRHRDLHSFVFGSMRLGVTGALHVGWAVPDPANVPPDLRQLLGRQFGARRDVYRQDPGLLNRHPPEEVQAFVGRLEGNKELSSFRGERKKLELAIKRIAAKRHEASEAEKQQMQEMSAKVEELRKKERGKQDEGAESIGRTLDPVDFLPQGLVLNHEMELVNASDAALGYFLQSLRHFSLRCRLGARESTGYGQVALEYDLKVNDGGFDLADAGTLRVAPYAFEMKSEHPAILRAQEAFEAARREPAKHFALDL